MEQRSGKKRIDAIEFVRGFCAFVIVAGHALDYSGHGLFTPFLSYPNGGVLPVTVNIFLMISGAMLYYNNPRIRSLPTFYYKRWKSIFPMFYLTWLFFYIINVIRAKTFLYSGGLSSFVFTLLGLDGYFLYKYSTYYIIGEWFLGGIVLLYLLYPLLLKCVSRFGARALLLLIPLWVWQLETNCFVIDTKRNLIYMAGMFTLGMLIFRYRLHEKTWLKRLSVGLSAVLLTVPLPIPAEYSMILGSPCFFMALFAIGEQLVKLPAARGLIVFLGGLSFPMFLVQNKIGYAMVTRLAPASYGAMGLCIVAAFLLCVGAAWCMKTVTAAVTKTKPFRILDGFFL